ncbi:MAG: hypothetical protein ACP5IE_08995 [Infirmifilum sp.]
MEEVFRQDMGFSFREWKTVTATRLIRLVEKYPEKQDKIESVLVRLQYLRVREITKFLVTLFLLSKEVPEALELVPEPDVVKKWMETGGNDE